MHINDITRFEKNMKNINTKIIFIPFLFFNILVIIFSLNSITILNTDETVSE